MDFSRFKTNDWLVVGGGALMLIAGFLTWYTVDVPSDLPREARSFVPKFSGFDYTLTGLIPWILLVGIAVVTVLTVGGVLKANVPPMAFLGLAAIATLLIIIRLIAGIGHGAPSEVSESRGIGLWLALLAGIISTAGAFLSFQAAGGNIRDFTDPNKLKGAVRDIDRR